MKKFIFAIAAMLVGFAAMMTSCNETVGGFLYNVNVDGNATGDVVVTFPNGELGLNGNVDLAFKYSNDSTIVKYGVSPESVSDLVDPATDERESVQNFAAKVNDGFGVTFKDAEAGGSYHVHIYGYAKEPNTGFIIAIDKVYDYPAPVDNEE